MRWHAQIVAHREELGSPMSREQGKPQAEAAARSCTPPAYAEWFAAEASRTYGDLILEPVRGKKMLV
ncbi:MAG: hypothetical protein IPI73_30840 [Betaproteobacteria bacterium]|nr:hypothetical protein [Betaproteobacteria bacterium]